MKNKIRFVTFYPKCPNLDLMKDAGQIPNTLGLLNERIDAQLVSCAVDLGTVDRNCLKGMKITKIPFVFSSDFLTGIVYILKNAKTVDWFNFYHGGRSVYYWTRLYKWLNPNGRVYLKTDLSYGSCRKYSSSKKEIRIFNNTASVVDIISVESEAIRKLVKQFCTVEISLISNGYFDVGSFSVKPTSERKKEFITVARLGDESKATDLLLEGFKRSAKEHDWNLRLVGPVDPAFEPFMKDFFAQNPDLRDRIIFEGPVFDKRLLYEYYNSARVFVLPSRWEGFPLVGPEASRCGCRMILTDIVPPFQELTDSGKYGIQIKTNDVDAIKEALIVESRREPPENEPMEISRYARDNLSWEMNCNRLMELMKI